jgi:hypothetical protein
MGMFIKKFFFIVVATTMSLCHAVSYKVIAKENLQSLTETNKQESLSSYVDDVETQGFDGVIKKKLAQQLNPGIREKRQLIFSMLVENENIYTSTTTDILDIKTIEDLEFLCGPKSATNKYVGAFIDRTQTESGRVALFHKLVNPPCNAQTLINQQYITKELVANQHLFDELDAAVKQMIIAENVLLSFWDSEDIFKLTALQDKEFPIPYEKSSDELKELSHAINTNTKAVMVSKTCRNIMGIASTAQTLYLTAAITYFALRGNKPNFGRFNEIAPKIDRIFLPFSILSFSGFGRFILRHSLYKDKKKVLEFDNDTYDYDDHYYMKKRKTIITQRSQIPDRMLAAQAIPDLVISSYFAIKYWLSSGALDKAYYTKMHYVALYIKNFEKICSLISKNPILASQLPQITQQKARFDTLAQENNDLQKLLTLLEKGTFHQGATPSLFTLWTRIKIAHLLMLNVKNCFAPTLQALGELDAQLSIAKLYKEHQNKNTPYCFPTYIADSATPAFNVVDSWNPLLPADKAIPNSIAIGKQFNERQNVIITGPNAGGKSTTTKGFIIAAILAQSLGIAPARELSLTPFSKIITYMNITDNTAEGYSLFAAGAKRAQELIDTSDTTEGFVLTVADEAFGGTNTEEGQASAKTLVQTLAEHPNTLCITNTHFPVITLLEDETDLFTNYKVSVAYNDENRIVYPFKLERGISHQKVAIKVLQEKGFNQKFLTRAQAIADSLEA